MALPRLSIGPEGGILLLSGIFSLGTLLFVPFDLFLLAYLLGYACLAAYFAYKYKKFFEHTATDKDIKHAKWSAYGLVVYTILELISLLTGLGGNIFFIIFVGLTLYSAIKKLNKGIYLKTPRQGKSEKVNPETGELEPIEKVSTSTELKHSDDSAVLSSPPSKKEQTKFKWGWILASLPFLSLYVLVVLAVYSDENGMFDPWMTFGGILGGLVIPLMLTVLIYYAFVVRLNIFTTDMKVFSARKALRDGRMYFVWFVFAFVWQLVSVFASGS